MMNSNLDQLSSKELSQANVAQRQISQKEFEIKLVDINSMHLSSQDAGTYYYNQQRKQLLRTEISNLKSTRDIHINTALMHALTLAERELNERSSTFSRASVLLSNIRSFLTIQNIRITVSLPVVLKMSLLNSRLQRTIGHASLKQELTNLKMQLQI